MYCKKLIYYFIYKTHNFKLCLLQSQFQSGVYWKVRRVTGWLLILGSILSCVYGVGLAATFTVPSYEPSIDTIQDIVNRRMVWGATHDAWIFSLTSSTEVKNPLFSNSRLDLGKILNPMNDVYR